MDGTINDSTKTPGRYRTNTSSFAHYWSQGMGVSLLKHLGFTPDLGNAQQYMPLLFQCDTAADKVVRLLHQNIGFAEAQRTVEQYLQDPQTVEYARKQVLDEFFGTFESAPSWINRDLMEKGLAFSRRSHISGLVVLRDYCLMGGYESAAINKPLIYTGALKKGAVKRISETVEFWVNITGHDALLYGNIGFNSIIKTRMIHSFARLNILGLSDWDTNKWGLPLNTWDMLATNLGFSLVYLTGLKKMGIEPLKEEIAGLFHLWKYVGYLLGIPVELMPDGENDAIEALYYWTMTQASGDEDSRLLAEALQQEPLQAYYPPSRFGRRVMREIHLFYNHYLLGSYSCGLLQLDKTVVGKIAYLNILRNKWDNRKIHDSAHYGKFVEKGRRTHEWIRQSYLENLEKLKQEHLQH